MNCSGNKCSSRCLQTGELRGANTSQLLSSAPGTVSMWWNLARRLSKLSPLISTQSVGPASDRYPIRDGKTQFKTKKAYRTGNRQTCLAKPVLATSWVAKQMIELSINAASPKPRGQWEPSCLLTPFRELGQIMTMTNCENGQMT